jgi:hypothetical protein
MNTASSTTYNYPQLVFDVATLIISAAEYKTGLDVDWVNQLIDTLTNDNDIIRFTILKLFFLLINVYIHFVY